MQIPRALISNYTKAINGISASARASITRQMAAFEFSGDIARDRERIINLMGALLRPYMTTVVPLATSFYDLVRQQSIGEGLGARLAVADAWDEHATQEAVRAFMQKAVDGAPEKIAPLLAERMDYEVKLAAHKAAKELGRRDPAKPRWARVPEGAETCEFCLMLASQGFVYTSEETADTHIHSGCDCRTVPSFGEGVEGYDPKALRDEYRARQEEKRQE